MRAGLVGALVAALLAQPLTWSRADRGDRRDGPEISDSELRAQVAELLASQARAVDGASAVVRKKLGDARARQAQQARVAARLLRPRESATALERARRRAVVSWVLAREHSEAELLAEEHSHLDQAAARLAAARTEAASAALPPRGLTWPARGQVARPFGRLVHERSGTTLARRGVELEVEDRADARAPAVGTVLYAGPLRGLDQGVLLQHAGYTTLVAKLGQVHVAAGQAVDPKVVLGRATRRRLYVELRLALLPAGLPIDPSPFFSSRSDR